MAFVGSPSRRRRAARYLPLLPRLGALVRFRQGLLLLRSDTLLTFSHTRTGTRLLPLAPIGEFELIAGLNLTFHIHPMKRILMIKCLGSFQYYPRSYVYYLNHVILRRSAPRCPDRAGWLRRRPRTGGRVKECGKPVAALVEPRTFEQCVLKEEHSNQTSGHGAGIAAALRTYSRKNAPKKKP